MTNLYRQRNRLCRLIVAAFLLKPARNKYLLSEFRVVAPASLAPPSGSIPRTALAKESDTDSPSWQV